MRRYMWSVNKHY